MKSVHVHVLALRVLGAFFIMLMSWKALLKSSEYSKFFFQKSWMLRCFTRLLVLKKTVLFWSFHRAQAVFCFLSYCFIKHTISPKKIISCHHSLAWKYTPGLCPKVSHSISYGIGAFLWFQVHTLSIQISLFCIKESYLMPLITTTFTELSTGLKPWKVNFPLPIWVLAWCMCYFEPPQVMMAPPLLLRRADCVHQT